MRFWKNEQTNRNRSGHINFNILFPELFSLIFQWSINVETLNISKVDITLLQHL